MVESQSHLTDHEIAQVEEHKYFLSESAGYDVGWEHAEQDWRAKFGTPEPESATGLDSAPQPESKTEADSSQAGDETHEKDARGIGGLFRRFFSKAAM